MQVSCACGLRNLLGSSTMCLRGSNVMALHPVLHQVQNAEAPGSQSMFDTCLSTRESFANFAKRCAHKLKVCTQCSLS